MTQQSQFGTRFTYGATFAPDGHPGGVLRDYETGTEIPFYMVDSVENLVVAILSAAIMIRDDATTVLTDEMDRDLSLLIGEQGVFYGTELGTIPLTNDEELPINLPEVEHDD